MAMLFNSSYNIVKEWVCIATAAGKIASELYASRKGVSLMTVFSVVNMDHNAG